MKHNYVAYMDKSDAPTALSRLAIALNTTMSATRTEP